MSRIRADACGGRFGQFRYQARLDRIVDGDTFDFTLDLGFKLHHVEQRVRLAAVDTAETHFVSHDSAEYERGQTHERFVREWFADGHVSEPFTDPAKEWPFVVATARDRTGAYGRYVATVLRKHDEVDLTDALLAEYGDAVRYGVTVLDDDDDDDSNEADGDDSNEVRD